MAKVFTGEEAKLIVNLSYNIRYTISDNNTSVAAVARKAGLDPSIIRNCIRGQVIPSQDNLKRIAEALDCTVDDLMKEYDTSMPGTN